MRVIGGEHLKRAGFTLVELLVVVGIIAVLAALLFPVFARVRAKAQNATCLSNLKQIGLALTQYTADHDGVFPPADQQVWVRDPQNPNRSTPQGNGKKWFDLVTPYTGKSLAGLRCPATYVPYFFPLEELPLAGYAYNAEISETVRVTDKTHRQEGRSETAVRYPSRLVTVFDARASLFGSSSPDSEYDEEDKQNLLREPLGAIRHNKRANYLFADGHVKSLQADAVQWGEEPDGTRPTFVP